MMTERITSILTTKWKRSAYWYKCLYSIRTIKLASARRLVLLMSCLLCGLQLKL